VKTVIWVVAIVLNVPVFIGFGWCFFGDWQGFLLDLVIALKALLLGRRLFDEDQEDFWKPFKIALFIISCGALVYGEGLLFSWLGWI
jgi:hypothetical protein